MFSMAECGGDLAPLVFRLQEGAPQLVREVLMERGWEEYEEEQDEEDWNLYWRTSAFRKSDYDKIQPWQRLNHHPKMGLVTRKDSLARHLKRMKMTFGSAAWNFSPDSYILPNDHAKFLHVYIENRGKSYWICKPVDLSRGRGIYVFDDIKDLCYDSPVIVQKYISNPLLISGYKFDLRIYVCVKSFCPLEIYIHQEGLVRFATEKYSLAFLDNLYSHLTNTSINKFGLSYTTEKERVGRGCKWSMSQFRTFLKNQGINDILLWQRISSIVTLTLATAAPSITSSPNCLEMLGFDILVDASLKPWLLEVNYSPALSVDCPTDTVVKKAVVQDLIDLMDYTPSDGCRQKAAREGSGGPRGACGSHDKPSRNLSGSKSSTKAGGDIGKRYSSTIRRLKSTSITGGKKAFKQEGSEKPEEGKLFQKVENEGQEYNAFIGKTPNRESTPSTACRLPTLHRLKSQKCVPTSVPASRVGDFILTFPFNEVTWKASQDEANVKTIFNEVRKTTTRMASAYCEKMKMKRETSDSKDAVSDKFGFLLWGPKIPPLVSECCHFSPDPS